MLSSASRPLADLCTAWAHGWTVARAEGAPQLLSLDGHAALDVPTNMEDRRIVLPAPNRDSVLAALAELSGSPDACLKFPGNDDEWAEHLLPGWSLYEPGWFMTRRLTRRTIGDEWPGCCVVVDVSEDTVRVEIWEVDDSGDRKEILSQGRLGAVRGSETAPPQLAGWGTVDSVWTLPGHRQRGLGRRVMLELENAALDMGLTDLVLTSSPMGLMLYDSCGWTENIGCVWAVTNSPEE